MSKRPVIGITTYAQEARWGVWKLPAALIPLDYVDAVENLDKQEWSPVQPSEEDSVKVMTIHQAKGLEFDHVFVPGVAAGLINLIGNAVKFTSIGEVLTRLSVRTRKRSGRSAMCVRAMRMKFALCSAAGVSVTFEIPAGIQHDQCADGSLHR